VRKIIKDGDRNMENAQIKELLLQSLEHEMGGVKIYEAAVKAAQNVDLKEEWQKYLQQMRHHVEVLQNTLSALGLNANAQSPGRKIVGATGKSLPSAIERAIGAGDPVAAELVACECVVLAETKDHFDWELIGAAAKKLKGEEKKALQAACDEVEDEEDEHLYYTKGWCRELWLQSPGIKAELPPPEECKHVKTAIGAARAEQARKPN
jgi:rubrerythrin